MGSSAEINMALILLKGLVILVVVRTCLCTKFVYRYTGWLRCNDEDIVNKGEDPQSNGRGWPYVYATLTKGKGGPKMDDCLKNSGIWGTGGPGCNDAPPDQNDEYVVFRKYHNDKGQQGQPPYNYVKLQGVIPGYSTYPYLKVEKVNCAGQRTVIFELPYKTLGCQKTYHTGYSMYECTNLHFD